jgi:hypothetical protein
LTLCSRSSWRITTCSGVLAANCSTLKSTIRSLSFRTLRSWGTSSSRHRRNSLSM